jgi:hypothetical protein
VCMRARPYLLLIPVLAACGGASRPDTPSAHKLQSVVSKTLGVGCSLSWTPNRRTFANPSWQQDSVRLGPVILLDAKRLSSFPVARNHVLKIRTLVRPSTAVTIRIEPVRPRTSTLRLGAIDGAAPTARALHYEGCSAVPREIRVIRRLPDVGYPMFIAVSRPSCATFTVETRGVSVHRQLSLGAGSCSG